MFHATDFSLFTGHLSPLLTLPASMVVFDIGDHLPGMKIQCRQNGDCSMPHVFVIPSDSGMLSRNRRKVRRGGSSRLNSRLLVEADSDDRSGLPFRSPEGGVLQVDLLVDHQDFGHLPVELRIPLLQVIPDPVRFDVGDIEDPPDRHPGNLRKPREACRFRSFVNEGRQGRQGPQLGEL